jgi:DHA1 family bicyclomycin/chloramphenicol resistance-like MFS transporter
LELLLVARVFAGLGIAATRVVTIALIRDCYSGRAMARVSSLAVMTFMIFPIIAPSIGELILQFGSWRLIFNMVAIVSAGIAGWSSCACPKRWRRKIASRSNGTGWSPTGASRSPTASRSGTPRR